MAGANDFNYETLIILINFVDVSPEKKTMIQRDLSPEISNKQNTRLEATAWVR